MAITKVLARDWTKEVDTTGSANWVDINGINSFVLSVSKSDADTTDFESQGWAEHLPTMRGMTITLEGFYLEDQSNGDRDPGQSYCETVARLVGPTSIVPFRFTTPGGTVWSFRASCQVEGPGGDHQAAANWQCTLTLSGQITIT